MNLDIKDGEFLVLVGPSGCGKSTTLRMLAGLEEVNKGRILIGGNDVTTMQPKDRDIAMVFQNYALYPHMTVADNMGFALKIAGTPKEEIRKRVEKAAEILDLTEYLDRKPKALSGGQRQRVAMGRAIVREPKVFLMDEPLSNLDAKLRVQTRTQIAALQRQLGVTTLYVTHDQTEALTMGDRIAVIKLGVLQQVGAPTELYDRPANVFVAGFIGSPSMNINTHPVVNGKAKIGEDTVDLPAEAVNKLTAEDGGKIVVGFRPEDATLATPDDPNAFSLKVQNIEDLAPTATSTAPSSPMAPLPSVHDDVRPEQAHHDSCEPACAAEDRPDRQDQDRPLQDAPVRSVDRAASELVEELADTWYDSGHANH